MKWLKLGSLAWKLRNRWYGFKKITPRMVVDTIADLYKFLTGKTLKIVVLCFVFSGSAFADPEQVLPTPSYDLLPLKTSRSVLVQPATCHVHIRVAGDGSKGRGTIIEPGNRVLTCQHLFRQSQRGITVELSNGKRVPAKLVKADSKHDLALLSIQSVDAHAVPVSSSKNYEILQLCVEPVVRYVKWTRITPREKINSVIIVDKPVKSGDSGGGLFNPDGIYGVIFGCEGGQTYCTAGKAVREFVGVAKADRLVIVSLPDNQCHPCALVSAAVKQLSGYSITKIHPNEYNGTESVSRFPTLLYYYGDTLVYRHEGAMTADQIKEYLDASSP